MTKKLLIHIVKNGETFKRTKEEQALLKGYDNIPGVWTIYGVNESKEICLEVAQTRNIENELSYDLTLICKDYKNADLTKRYAARRLFNQFSKKFNVCKCDKNRLRAKYRDIAQTFSELKIYILCEAEENKYTREVIEMEHAIHNKALYWNAWGKQRKNAHVFYNEMMRQNKLK